MVRSTSKNLVKNDLVSKDGLHVRVNCTNLSRDDNFLNVIFRPTIGES